jgi:hypothetical protein
MSRQPPGGTTTANGSTRRHGRNLPAADRLLHPKAASVPWLAAFTMAGLRRPNAGYQKPRGSESAAFRNSGASVKGFAAAGVAGSKAGTGGASYG